MGFVYVKVCGLRSSRTIRMLVDTGSTYIVLSSDIVRELGLLETPYSVELADGRKASRLYLAEVEARGRRGRLL